jgi:hypothetical protein
MKLVKKTGIFKPDGEIVLHPGISVFWKSLSNKSVPELPQGTPLDIDVTLDEKAILSGEYGIVWATWDQRQAEVIYNALLGAEHYYIDWKNRTGSGLSAVAKN